MYITIMSHSCFRFQGVWQKLVSEPRFIVNIGFSFGKIQTIAYIQKWVEQNTKSIISSFM